MQNEVSYILIGQQSDSICFGKLVRKRKGTSGSVEFDWKWALEREEKRGDVLGFYHSHPNNQEISGRDIKTMMTWISCFDKSLLCIIEDSSSRKNKAYVFPSDSGIIAFYPYQAEILRVSNLILGVLGIH